MDTDVLICGAGAPGLTLALLLARIGVDVTVIDRVLPASLKTVTLDGRTSALMQGSTNIVKAAGAWDATASFGEAMKTLRIVDDSVPDRKTVTVDFQAHEIGLDCFGTNMPNAALNAALADCARKTQNLSFIAPATIKGLKADAFGITVQTGERNIRARLLVGADGRGSAVRTLSGIGADTHAYGQNAITCVIGHSKPHQNISTEFHRSSGPFTLVPLPGKKSSVVWVDFQDAAARFMALSRPAFLRALQDRSKGTLGELTLECEPSSWPLIGQRAHSLTAPRTVLIAESAHVLHPLGAQGLNLSLRDVGALAETVADAVRLGQDIGHGSVLRTYEMRRRQDTLSRIYGTDGFNKLVSTDLGFLKTLRQASLQQLGRVAPLKRFAMRQGLAPALDESRLARGEAL